MIFDLANLIYKISKIYFTRSLFLLIRYYLSTHIVAHQALCTCISTPKTRATNPLLSRENTKNPIYEKKLLPDIYEQIFLL